MRKGRLTSLARQIVTVTQSGSTRRKRPHHHHHHQRPKTKYITVTSWATTTVPAGVSTSVSALAQWQPSTTAWTATSSTTHWESTWLAAAASSTSSTSNWQTSWLASSTTSSVGAAIASSSTSSSTSSSAVSTTTGTATGGGSVSVCNGCTYPMTKNPFPSFSAANAFTVSVYAGTSNDLFTVGSCGLKAPGNMNKYPTYDASLLPLAMPDTAMDVGGTGEQTPCRRMHISDPFPPHLTMSCTGYANFLCGQIITISIDGSDGLTKGTYQAVIASRESSVCCNRNSARWIVVDTFIHQATCQTQDKRHLALIFPPNYGHRWEVSLATE